MKKKTLALLLCLLFLATGCAASAPVAPKTAAKNAPITAYCGEIGRFPSLTREGRACFSYNAGEDTASGTCPLFPCADCSTPVCPRCGEDACPYQDGPNSQDGTCPYQDECPNRQDGACPYQDECPNRQDGPNSQDGACPYRDGRPACQGGGRGRGNGWRWSSRTGSQSPAI